MRRDRLALMAAYVLLVFVTAWNAWDTQRTLDRLEEDVCATAEVEVGSGLLNLAVYGQQAGVNAEAYAITIDALLQIADLIERRCGVTFLDEIELTPVTLPLDEQVSED